MIIAGGGGGKAWDGLGAPTFPGIDGNIGEAGSDGFSELNELYKETLRYGVGGVDGNGSTLFGPHGNAHAGNGAGFYTNGEKGDCGSGGNSFLSGGAGGSGCSGGSNGGYGGGAGGGNAGGGGGGGYSGGGGSYHTPTNGGGGGSYNSGANPENIAGVGKGNGQVIIELLCAELTVKVSAETICLGDSFTLEAKGKGEIKWDGGVLNGVPFTPLTAGTTMYTTTSDLADDCIFSIAINVVDNPTVTASADKTEVCDGESVKLKGGGAYTYIWDLGVINDVSFVPALGTTAYTVIGKNIYGCADTTSINITVHEIPVVTANVDDEAICLGEFVVFNGGGAVDYSWDKGVINGAEFTPAALGVVTYKVIGTDVNGCENTATIDVTVFEALIITYTTTEEIMGADGEIDITIIGGNPPYIFDWEKDGVGSFDDTEDLTGLIGGTYTVVVKDQAGCSITEIITLNSQVGIGELDRMVVSIYPNPTTEKTTINLEGAFTYELTTVNGEVVRKGNGFDTEEIELGNLAKGMYLIRINTGNQITVMKLIKK